ncbi:MAG: class I SAM-dependent methyltransferase [Thermodesulfobacteriota bacterium]
MMVFASNIKSPWRYVSITTVILAATLSFVFSASARDGDNIFSIHSGAELAGDSANLDVGYVPTPMGIVDAMFALCPMGPKDFLIDMGSGDGRIVITAAKRFGARGLGVDLNPKLVALSKKYALAEGVADRTEFLVQDIFLTNIHTADVVTMYLLPEVNMKLRPKLLKELRPGARIVSHDYHLGDWRPDKTVLLEKIKQEGDDSILYFWVVPANVAGTWHWRIDLRGNGQDFILELQQHYQDISGSAQNQGQPRPLFNAGLSGDHIRFSISSEADGRIVRQDYEGRVTDDAIEGAVKVSGATEEKQVKWQAFRKAAPARQ